jgi:3-hydroxyisobutyrate dehydrogenase-like beta-hydroxyacid dehydrogenase
MSELVFIGVGTMGAPMAEHLLRAGHAVAVFDQSGMAMRSLIGKGASAADSVRAVAARSELVFLSLPGPSEVSYVVAGPQGILDADARPEWIVDLSTNSPQTVRELSRRCREVGITFIDAPVSGGRLKAESGELTVLVGAGEDEFSAIKPYLGCFGADIIHVGPSGAGAVAKLVNNQLFLGASVLLQEAYLLGAAVGLLPNELHPIIKASSAAPYATLAPLLLSRRFDRQLFRLDIAAKDIALAVEVAREAGVDTPITEAAARLYQDAVGAGFGGEVFYATLKQLEAGSGTTVPALNVP